MPKLVTVAASSVPSVAVRAAAARALAAIDPPGCHVMATASSLKTLDGVLTAAQLAGAGTEPLASILSQSLAHIYNVGPLAGWMAASMAELIRAVFGSVPTHERRQWLNTREKRLRTWMENGRLRFLKIDHGVYHLRIEDLQRVRLMATDSGLQEPGTEQDGGHTDPQTS